ncbi:MAG TPA: ASKHA domain-containing protein [Candidatus Sulfotelmatobacter sp.]|nr:ASKHA domain-containing protein [Candidatus Sulfotelmatobacter sp.]
MTSHPIRFVLHDRIYAAQGEGTLLDLAALAGVSLPSLCGGRGKCAKCRCRPEGPITPATPLEAEMLSPEELAQGIRLGCQVRPLGAVAVRLQAESLDKGEAGELALQPEPGLRQAYLELPRPARHDDCADLERIEQGLGHSVKVALPVLQGLPTVLRQSDFRVTASLWAHDGSPELLAVEAGDRRGEAYGLAVDIGTTTVVGYLHDLLTGREIARASRLNGQQPWGADVLSRASHAMEAAGGLADLQRAIVGTLNHIIAECTARIDPRHVYCVTVVGNSLMHHLALGLPPAPIAVSPYVPVARGPLTVRAAELGLALPNASAYFLPLIGAYVGADTLAVILATGLDESAEVGLAVDIGTNGEMALGSRERLLACSAPAGPAFEGAEIRFGMRATTGAIDRVRIRDDVRVWTIGDAPPCGICGSGLVDAVAQMVGSGLVDRGGRLLPRPQVEGRLSASLLERLVSRDGGWEFVLARDPYVAVTQEDVRKLQLAKATIECGVRILMEELGVEMPGVASVALAGAFGNFIDPRSALAIGLLPAELPRDRIRGVGNAAGQGARMALLSRTLRRRAEAVARRVEYFELSKHPRFEERFVDCLRLGE